MIFQVLLLPHYGFHVRIADVGTMVLPLVHSCDFICIPLNTCESCGGKAYYTTDIFNLSHQHTGNIISYCYRRTSVRKRKFNNDAHRYLFVPERLLCDY